MNSVGINDQVTIYVKMDGSEVTEQYDRNDVCMKVAIASYEILSKGKDDEGNEESALFSYSEPQIVLHLRNFKVTVKYEIENVSKVEIESDSEADVVGCAVDSVLKALYKGQCVGKDSVSYQSRQSTYTSQKEHKISEIRFINLNPNKEPEFSFNFKEGIISRTYAYLEERKLCLFLNEISKETLDKIDQILSGLFPRFSNKI